jgi:hypothetical protein
MNDGHISSFIQKLEPEIKYEKTGPETQKLDPIL